MKLLASAHETSDIKSFAEIIILSSDSKAFSHNGIKREKDGRSKELICHRVSHYLYRAQLKKKKNVAWFMFNPKVSKCFSKPYLRRATFGLQRTSLLISGH